MNESPIPLAMAAAGTVVTFGAGAIAIVWANAQSNARESVQAVADASTAAGITPPAHIGGGGSDLLRVLGWVLWAASAVCVLGLVKILGEIHMGEAPAPVTPAAPRTVTLRKPPAPPVNPVDLDGPDRLWFDTMNSLQNLQPPTEGLK